MAARRKPTTPATTTPRGAATRATATPARRSTAQKAAGRSTTAGPAGPAGPAGLAAGERHRADDGNRGGSDGKRGSAGTGDRDGTGTRDGTRDGDGAYSFDAALWEWESQGGWFFVSLPEDLADEIDERYGHKAAGFGSLRVEVTIGATVWATSLFPDTKRGTYVLPVKKAVRKAERLAVGSTLSVTVRLLV